MTDGLRRADGRYDGRVGDRLLPPLHTEIKEDQWLGGAVTSQGEIIGHLWPEWGGVRWKCCGSVGVNNTEGMK